MLPSTFGFMTSARIASSASCSPDSGWDTRRALHRSPPNESDCHAPSSRGSFRQCITMYSTLACPRHTCCHHPCTHQAWCLRRLCHALSSCCLVAASVRGRTTTEWLLLRNVLPWHSMATPNITSSLVQSPTGSSGRTLVVQLEWLQLGLCAATCMTTL